MPSKLVNSAILDVNVRCEGMRPMVDLEKVLMRFNLLNDLSGLQEVTGRAQRVWNRTDVGEH